MAIVPRCITYHPGAIKQLEKIEPDTVRRQIIRKINGTNKDPKRGGARKLSGPHDAFRTREGEQRTVHALGEAETIILKTGHRSEVYR